MQKVTKEQVMAVLRTIEEPELRKDYVSLNMVKDVRIEDGKVTAVIELTTPACPMKARIKDDIAAAIHKIDGVKEVDVRLDSSVRASSALRPDKNRIPGVKNVIVVGSGKGGVGKSTVAVNIAFALSYLGAKVALLDADIYGPSLPIMLGLTNASLELGADDKIIPLQSYGVDVISMGNLMKSEDAVIWRGPMLHKALQQFLEDVNWGEKDYLVIDLPPGTGDVALTLSQLIPISGAIAVTTPQDVAFADVRRAMTMFRKLQVPLLGVVLNMSYFETPDDHKIYHIFGKSQIQEELASGNIPFLGEIPIEMETRASGDDGIPIVVKSAQSNQSKRFIEIAKAMAGRQSMANLQVQV